MIVGVFGCPALTKIAWTFLFDALGAPFLYVSKDENPEVVRPTVRRAFMQIRMVLCYDVESFYNIQDRLRRAVQPYCVFVTGNPILMEDSQLPLWPNPELTINDLLSFDSLIANAPVFVPISSSKTQIRDQYITNTSVVQRCHTLFYRVADKDERNKMQRSVWNYLSGKTKTIQPTGIKALDAILISENAKRLRVHAIRAKEVGVDAAVVELGADEFELQYLLHKSLEANSQ